MPHFAFGPRGARAAVSLTYDDALVGHWFEVAPQLERAGLRGTFNVVPHPRFFEHLDAWRRVAAAGHELGNHTLFHPCRKEPPERFGWLPDDFDLCRYTAKRWREEIRVANELLKLIDGRSTRSFANTCCNTHLGPADALVELAPLILEQCIAGRGPCNSRIIDPAAADLGALGHFDGDARTFDQLREPIDRAIATGGWVIYMFHGVGPAEHRLHVDPVEHARLLDYLAARQPDIHTAPMADIAKAIASATS